MIVDQGPDLAIVGQGPNLVADDPARAVVVATQGPQTHDPDLPDRGTVKVTCRKSVTVTSVQEAPSLTGTPTPACGNATLPVRTGGGECPAAGPGHTRPGDRLRRGTVVRAGRLGRTKALLVKTRITGHQKQKCSVNGEKLERIVTRTKRSSLLFIEEMKFSVNISGLHSILQDIVTTVSIQ